MENGPEQYKFDFEGPEARRIEPSKIVEVETEEKVICDYCNQKFDSKEGGCRYCGNERMKLQRQKESKAKNSH